MCPGSRGLIWKNTIVILMLQFKTVSLLTILIYSVTKAPTIGCYVTSGSKNNFSWMYYLPLRNTENHLEVASVASYSPRARDLYMSFPWSPIGRCCRLWRNFRRELDLLKQLYVICLVRRHLIPYKIFAVILVSHWDSLKKEPHGQTRMNSIYDW